MSNPLPPGHNILRHIKGTQRDDEVVNGSAFVRRPSDDNGLSVNWMERFGGAELEQLREIQERFRLNVTSTHRFARLRVGTVIEHVTQQSVMVSMMDDPLPATAEFAEDPSHALIKGLPDPADDMAALVGDMIAECVEQLYPCVPENLK